MNLQDCTLLSLCLEIDKLHEFYLKESVCLFIIGFFMQVVFALLDNRF